MAKNKGTGVYQLPNGYWAFRYVLTSNKQRKEVRKSKDELGNPFKTQNQAIAARKIALEREHAHRVPIEPDIVSFTKDELARLDVYFQGTNAETAYLLGRFCGLRINECYGLKWENVDIENGTITIDRQMQYQEGLIKLVPLKTRNARRTLYRIIPLLLSQKE